MLSLDDERWSLLHHAYGSAEGTPDILRRVADDDEEAWEDLWSSLCHQGTVFTASYAAVPHIVEIAKGRIPKDRHPFLWFVGFVAGASEPPPCPEFLRPDFEEGLRHAQTLTLESVRDRALTERQAVDLLSSLAGLYRDPFLCELMTSFIDGEYEVECQSCGGYVHLLVEGARVTFSDNLRNAGSSFRGVVRPRSTGKLPPTATTLEELSRELGWSRVAHLIALLYGRFECPHCGVTIDLASALSAQYLLGSAAGDPP